MSLTTDVLFVAQIDSCRFRSFLEENLQHFFGLQSACHMASADFDNVMFTQFFEVCYCQPCF